jgi:hypothetical protein
MKEVKYLFSHGKYLARKEWMNKVITTIGPYQVWIFEGRSSKIFLNS